MERRIKYPGGNEIIWLAEDQEENIAGFVTAGRGPIPKFLVDDYDIGKLTTSEWDLPEISAKFEPEPETDFFRDLVAKGILVFDWNDVHKQYKTKGYEKMLTPSSRLRATNLPSILRSAIALTKLPQKFERKRHSFIPTEHMNVIVTIFTKPAI